MGATSFRKTSINSLTAATLLALLIAFVALFASQIARAAPAVLGTTTESRYAREATPAKGKAIIYIYRRHDDPAGLSPPIWLNTFEVGRLPPGTFTAWQLSPGRLEIRTEGVAPSTLSVTSEAGKVYLIRVSVTQSAQGPSAQLARIAPESGRTDMAATQLIKNPREVSETAALVPPPALPPKPAVAPRAEPPPPPAPAKAAAEPEVPAGPLSPGGFALLLKGGQFTLSNDSQKIGNVDRDVNDKASGVYSIEAYYQLRNGFTVGVEYMGYSTEIHTPGFSDKNDVDVTGIFINGKKYFQTDSHFQPYIGAGLGGTSTDVSGPTINGSTSGFSYQVMVGAEYRGKSFGVFGEYKYINADTESDNNEKIDLSGSGFFAGISLHF